MSGMFLCVVSLYLFLCVWTARFTSFAKVKVIVEAEVEIARFHVLVFIPAAKVGFFFLFAKKMPDYFPLAGKFCLSQPSGARFLPRLRPLVPPSSLAYIHTALLPFSCIFFHSLPGMRAGHSGFAGTLSVVSAKKQKTSFHPKNDTFPVHEPLVSGLFRAIFSN
ncbi:MAG: hypothetical protein J1F27_01810 [Prevotellaceae bacterium]|nr:hypothetical protein [Prevotellaceae bacterium]